MQCDQPKINRFSLSLMVLAIGFCVTGTQACQENYYFARQYSVSPSPSETETGDVTESPTPTSTTGTPTSSPTGGESPTAKPTETDTPTEEPTISEVYGIFRRSVANSVSDKQAAKATNWLGKIASKEIDRDGDGYSDALESRFGSASDNAESVPEIVLLTKLNERMQRQDSDFDGLINQDELLLGADPNNSDSDGDGVLDGIEVLSGRNPLKFESRSSDSDGDSLSDEYEDSIGTNSKSIDSDGDGLKDDTELILGSDPLNPDSDGDGILDGKEVELGSDPTIPDYTFN